MKVYIGQTRSRKLIAELSRLGFGECTNRGEYPPRRRPWFFDNGSFSDWKAGKPWDADAWRRDLDRIREGDTRPDFVVAPDIIAGGAESLEHSRSQLAHLEGFKTYLVAQDGMHPGMVADALEGFAGIFVGGTLEWKMSTGAAWCVLADALGVPCHLGRIGTARRVRWAVDVGAASIDSCLPLWSGDNLRVFRAALKTQKQKRLWS